MRIWTACYIVVCNANYLNGPASREWWKLSLKWPHFSVQLFFRMGRCRTHCWSCSFLLPGRLFPNQHIAEKYMYYVNYSHTLNKFPVKYYPTQSLLGLCRGLMHFHWLSATAVATVLTYGAAKAWNVSKPLEAKKTDFGLMRVCHLWMNL